MAYTTVTTVVAGNKGTAAWGNAVAAKTEELEDAVTVVRRRDIRTGTSYATGSTTLAPGLGSIAENQGGVTLTGNTTYTVPTLGTYACTVLINPTTAFGTTSQVIATVSRGGVTYLMNKVLQNTSVAEAMSWVLYLAAADTVVFAFDNGTGGAITADIECQVARVTPPNAP